MNQLVDLLREAEEIADGERRNVSQIDGRDRGRNRRKSLKQRLGFKGVCCCGPPWSSGQNTNARRENEEEEEEEEEAETVAINPDRTQDRVDDASGLDSNCPTPSSSEMSLATALELERYARPECVSKTPSKVPLMRLLAETGGCDSGWECSESVCCVCMGRVKGAAFISCGHTFCRVCTREIRLIRGKCPLCNRSISNVLDLY